jgi:hypothetical protein
MNLRKEVTELLELATMVQPEGEPLDLQDREYTPTEMSELRSHLSQQRRNIDLINNALARAWQSDYPNERYDDGANEWWVGRTKGKHIVDAEMFYAWLATKDAGQLAKLVSPSAVKVGGMTPVERETHLDETPINDRLSIKSKPTEMI